MTLRVGVPSVSGGSGVGRVSGWRLIALWRFPPEAPSSWHPFSLPAAACCAGIGLATCWLLPQIQRINMFLSEMTERRGGGIRIVNMFCLISPLPDLFLIPPLPRPSLTLSNLLWAAAGLLASWASLPAVWRHISILHLYCKSLLIIFHLSRTLAIKPLSLV